MPLSRPASFAMSTLAVALSLIAAATIVGCQPAAGNAAATPSASPAPLPVVQVAAVQQRAVAPQLSQVGRVEAAHRVEVRPRVAGHIQAVLFRDGDIVRAGQPLFRIDPRPFDVALERARAELQLARAKESLARSEAERAQHLASGKAISTQEVERRTAAHAEAVALSAAAQSAVRAAALDREFAVITAPATGRIGRTLATPGNYVGAGAGQPLATLTAVSPLHVYFDVGDAALIGQLAGQRKPGRWQARILDPQSSALLAAAPIDFVDNEMVAGTGTLRMRARIDRPIPGLVPGQFVRVQLSGPPADSLLVPEKAIATDQGQRFVLVVQPDQQVAYRAVQLGPSHGDERVIASGLQAGDRVVVSGLMKVRPGMKVQPQGAPAESGQAQAGTASNS